MNLTSIFCQLFSVFYPLKSKAHLVPHHIAVNRYRYSFVKETELAIIMDQFFLAGEDKTSPSFLFRIMGWRGGALFPHILSSGMQESYSARKSSAMRHVHHACLLSHTFRQ